VLISLFISAAVATMVKMKYIIHAWNQVGPVTVAGDLWAELEIWTVTEHGSSVFACSVLALRPLISNAAKRLSSLSASYDINFDRKDSDASSSSSVNVNSPSRVVSFQDKQAASTDSLDPASKLGGCSEDTNYIVETKSMAAESCSIV
jgi:hypothetical protein